LADFKDGPFVHTLFATAWAFAMPGAAYLSVAAAAAE